MNHDSVKEAIEEAKRFLTAAWTWQKAERCKKEAYHTVPKEAGACRRASMDLSRALSELRKPG